MATSSYSNIFGTNGAGKQGSQAGISTLFGQQATARQDDDEEKRRQQQQQQAGQAAQTQTFAQMQQAGQARPAPPPPGGAQQAPQSSQTVQQLQQRLQPQAPRQAQAADAGQAYGQMLGQLQQRLGQAFEQPSGYTTPEFQQLRQAQMGQLQQEFGAQRQALEEDLARRGLASSSIGAGRFGDLAGQQSQAMANVQAQLLQQQAEMGQRGRESALRTLADVTGQIGQRGLGEQELNIKSRELEQRQSQFESSLGAEEQRFVRTLEEQRAGRLQQLGISNRQLDQDALRIQQQDRSLTIQEARDKAEVEYRAKALEQQLAMQGIQITADEARQRAQIDFQREQMASDEALRREGFTVDRERIAQAQRQFDASFGFQQGQAQQSLAMELARIFSASDNPQAAATIMPILQEMLKGLPGYQASMTPPPAGTPAPTPTPTPAPTPAPAPAPTANPYNNPLGPISGTNQATTAIPDFSEILRMGAQGYNPYNPYAGMPFGGTL